MENILIEDYKNKKEILLEEVFQEWVSQKLEYGEIQKQTFNRYTTDFYRFFNGSDIAKKDVRKIIEDDLELFVRGTIKNMNLSHKSYGGLRLLIIWNIQKKYFARKMVKDEESVFTDGEVERISKYIEENISLINMGTNCASGVLKLDIEERTVNMCSKFESPKTEAGNRDIILNSEALKTLKRIRKLNPFGE